MPYWREKIGRNIDRDTTTVNSGPNFIGNPALVEVEVKADLAVYIL